MKWNITVTIYGQTLQWPWGALVKVRLLRRSERANAKTLRVFREEALFC